MLLDAALELFGTRGFETTTIEQICQTAFVSTKSFYEAFSSKEDCYLALYERTAEEFRSIISVAEHVDHADAAAEAEFLIESYVDMVLADKRKAAVTFGGPRAVSEAVSEAKRVNRMWTADFIETVWERQGHTKPPRRVSVAVVAGIFEVVIEYLLDEEAAPELRRSVIDDLITYYTAVREGLDAIGAQDD